MILSDYDIARSIELGHIAITPFSTRHLGTNSYDLHLSVNFATYKNQVLDCRRNNQVNHFVITQDGYTLQPGILYLACTIEHTACKDLVPSIEGKSSLGRLGLDIHKTAGFGDAGFSGHWTLEMSVTQPLIVYPGMPIAQIYWTKLSSSATLPYDKKVTAKYADQPGYPVPSKMYMNFITEDEEIEL